jgi:hypothetical protein
MLLLVPSEDGVCGEQVNEINAGAQMDIKEVHIVCQVQFTFRKVLDSFVTEFPIVEEQFD